MKKVDDIGNIRILTGLEAVRQRLTMYVGPLNNVLIPNLLLREALCCPRDEAMQGRCKNLDIFLDKDGSATVSDDGPGLPLDLGPCGQRKAEAYLQNIHACASGKSSEEIARTTCVLGLAALNAFAAELSIRIFADGSEWRQDYRAGVPISALSVAGKTNRQGTELSFKLDSSILENREFRLDEFKEWLALNVKGITINLRDLRTNEIASFGV